MGSKSFVDLSCLSLVLPVNLTLSRARSLKSLEVYRSKQLSKNNLSYKQSQWKASSHTQWSYNLLGTHFPSRGFASSWVKTGLCVQEQQCCAHPPLVGSVCSSFQKQAQSLFPPFSSQSSLESITARQHVRKGATNWTTLPCISSATV